jgi:hypothetical protein
MLYFSSTSARYCSLLVTKVLSVITKI